MKNKYDLIIAGGGTAGCACAYTAGKLGLDVLLIEKNSFLGGTMTSSLVTPAMSPKTKNTINTSFYELFMKKLHEIGGQITYNDGNIGWFNPELAKIILDRLMDEAKIDVLFNSEISDLKTEGNHITSVKIGDLISKISTYNDTIYTDNINEVNSILSEYVETKYVVDGTGDAKIFQKLKLDFLNNFENKSEKKYQPVTLRFIMSGIDIKEFSEWIMEFDKDRDVTTSYTTDGQIHLSTAYTWDKGKKWALEPVFRSGIKEGLIKEEDVNYFQVFTIPQMPSALAFNCPRIIEPTDVNDKQQVSHALKQGRESILRLSTFLKQKFKGFENAYISNIANALGIRVSNRIKGKYVYTIDDLKSGKRFDNPCLVSSYPVDIHSSKRDDSVLEDCNVDYMLPIESLISADYDNLFAVGRCLSADFHAQAALRIIPACFSMGEGLARYLNSIK